MSNPAPLEDMIEALGIRHGIALPPLPLFIENPGASLDIPLETNLFADMPPGEAELMTLQKFETDRSEVKVINSGFANMLSIEFPLRSPIFLTVCLDIRGRPSAALEAATSVLKQNYPHFELILINEDPDYDIRSDLNYRFSGDLRADRLHILTCMGTDIPYTITVASIARGRWILHLDSRHGLIPGSLARLSMHLTQVAGNSVMLPSWKGDAQGLAGLVHKREKVANFEKKSPLWRWEYDFLGSLGFPIPLLRDPQLAPIKVGATHADPKLAPSIARNQSSLAKQPIVTTVITCYEQGQFIDEAIRSALMQAGHFRHQIIIADDGSQDMSQDIIEAYALRYPDIIRNSSSRDRKGQSARLRQCIAEADGNYICILDGDDTWLSANKIQSQLDFLSRFPKAQICFSGCLLMNQEGMDYPSSEVAVNMSNIFALSQILLGANPLTTLSTVMGNAAIFQGMPKYLDYPWLTEYGVCAWFSRYGDLGYSFQKHVMHRIPGGHMTFKNLRDNILASIITISNAMSAAASKNQASFLDAINRLEKSLHEEEQRLNIRRERNRILRLAYPGMFPENQVAKA